ncbi:hypothetical protein N8I74_06935 [Chitiniphilus purpureus]|uniref:Uncharacterized protein n=1 Tax=Chitiniphilus purpureus TaxID=2981137 RepID=A0ABY6DQU9_9NEIS|nr:hypothetical protein [Chitiniphilus sp. CD1]UXY16749.1 hypothetical protein N8I74_06935 [Chitiniphilus sp. CD1]
MDWYIENVVPALIGTAVLCLLLYVLLARLLFDYIARNYGDLLPKRETWMHGDDIAMGFITTLGDIGRSGNWRRIAHPFWRRLFVANRVIGWVGTLALMVFLAGFLI